MMVLYLHESVRSIPGFAKFLILEIGAVIGYTFILLLVRQILKPPINRHITGGRFIKQILIIFSGSGPGWG
tara:strand:+ start:66 stop:278 length:213 start_codon:yes stop_codon:yes gene_type:complete